MKDRTGRSTNNGRLVMNQTTKMVRGDNTTSRIKRLSNDSTRGNKSTITKDMIGMIIKIVRERN
jgi:hypothetical protein